MTDPISELIADRRTLHRRPEEGWTEFETTWYVAQRLTALGIPFKAGIEVVDPEAVMGRYPEKVAAGIERAIAHGVPQAFIDRLGGYTGVVAEVVTGRPGPVTALRFDMDCVCVGESDAPDHVPAKEGFASENPGLMHACGHDAHTAVGLAAARWVAENKDSLCGTIRLIFQPAEEGTRGAQGLVAAGVVDDVSYFVGAHVGAGSQEHEIVLSKGGFLATTKMDISFTGVPSHAGSDPHKGKSALLAAAACTMMLEGIPRHGEGASRIAIGTLRAGEGRNVTPVHAVMQIETRGETDAINQYMEDNVRNIVDGVAKAYGVKAEVRRMGAAMTLPLCEDFCNRLMSLAATVPGIDSVRDTRKPSGSEDCTIFMNRVVEKGGQAAFFTYGGNKSGHHKSDFDIPDTESLPAALEFLKRVITDLNGPEA